MALDLDDERELDWPPRRRRGVLRASAARASGSRARCSARRSSGSPAASTTRRPRSSARFDLVFCGSVLIHLRDQLLALERIAQLCRGTRHRRPRSTTGSPARLPLESGALPGRPAQAVVFWQPTSRPWRRMMWTAGFDAVTEHGRFALRSPRGSRCRTWCSTPSRRSPRAAEADERVAAGPGAENRSARDEPRTRPHALRASDEAGCASQPEEAPERRRSADSPSSGSPPSRRSRAWATGSARSSTTWGSTSTSATSSSTAARRTSTPPTTRGRPCTCWSPSIRLVAGTSTVAVRLVVLLLVVLAALALAAYVARYAGRATGFLAGALLAAITAAPDVNGGDPYAEQLGLAPMIGRALARVAPRPAVAARLRSAHHLRRPDAPGVRDRGAVRRARALALVQPELAVAGALSPPHAGGARDHAARARLRSRPPERSTRWPPRASARSAMRSPSGSVRAATVEGGRLPRARGRRERKRAPAAGGPARRCRRSFRDGRSASSSRRSRCSLIGGAVARVARTAGWRRRHALDRPQLGQGAASGLRLRPPLHDRDPRDRRGHRARPGVRVGPAEAARAYRLAAAAPLAVLLWLAVFAPALGSIAPGAPLAGTDYSRGNPGFEQEAEFVRTYTEPGDEILSLRPEVYWLSERRRQRASSTCTRRVTAPPTPGSASATCWRTPRGAGPESHHRGGPRRLREPDRASRLRAGHHHVHVGGAAARGPGASGRAGCVRAVRARRAAGGSLIFVFPPNFRTMQASIPGSAPRATSDGTR